MPCFANHDKASLTERVYLYFRVKCTDHIFSEQREEGNECTRRENYENSKKKMRKWIVDFWPCRLFFRLFDVSIY